MTGCAQCELESVGIMTSRFQLPYFATFCNIKLPARDKRVHTSQTNLKVPDGRTDGRTCLASHRRRAVSSDKVQVQRTQTKERRTLGFRPRFRPDPPLDRYENVLKVDRNRLSGGGRRSPKLSTAPTSCIMHARPIDRPGPPVVDCLVFA